MRLTKKLLERCRKIVKLTDWKQVERELAGCSYTRYERYGTGPKGRFRALVYQGGPKLPWISTVDEVTKSEQYRYALDSLYGSKTRTGAQRAITPWLIFRAGRLGVSG